MTGTELAAKIRYYTKTSTATFSNGDMLPIVNSSKDELAGLAVIKNEDLFIVPSTVPLVASTVTAREYPLPDDMLNELVTVEIGLKDTDNTVYVPVRPYPGGMQQLLIDLNGITESKITDYFNNEKPRYILTRRGLYILSGSITSTHVTNANLLKLRYRLYPADLANLTGSAGLQVDPTTTSFGVPISLHELWARRVSIIWKQSRPKPIPLSDFEKLYNSDLQVSLNGLAKNDLGQELFATVPYDD